MKTKVQENLQDQEVEQEQKEINPLAEWGVTDKQLADWKAKWGKLFKTVVGGQAYVWRTLRRGEYREIMKDKAAEGQEQEKLYDRQEKISKLVVIFPANIEELVDSNAGLAASISDEVIYRSGFDVEPTEEI